MPENPSESDRHAATDDSADKHEKIIREAIVPDTMSGQRCDQIAARLFPEFSRGKLQSWIQSGELTADGQQCKPKQKLYDGARLYLAAQQQAVSAWLPEDKPLTVIFEDDHVLVLNKPAGCVVHPAAGISSGTLANSVLAHCPDNAQLPRCGIVHRLDKDTTGLMVVAKSLQAHASLVEQLQQRTVSRIYRAIVCGRLISGGTVDAPIGRHPTARTKMAVLGSNRRITAPDNRSQDTAKTQSTSVKGAKHAITHYRISERFSQFTELSVKLETGRTHQIRVHMADIHHPLVGDATYNPRYQRPANISESLDDTLRHFSRQALHAYELSFNHPTQQSPCSFSAAVPTDYAELLAALQNNEKLTRGHEH